VVITSFSIRATEDVLSCDFHEETGFMENPPKYYEFWKKEWSLEHIHISKPKKNHLTVVIDGEEATVLRMNEKGVQEQTVLVPLGSNQFLEKVVTDGSIPGVVSHYFWSFYMAKKDGVRDVFLYSNLTPIGKSATVKRYTCKSK
jgi:hypothetical protein